MNCMYLLCGWTKYRNVIKHRVLWKKQEISCSFVYLFIVNLFKKKKNGCDKWILWGTVVNKNFSIYDLPIFSILGWLKEKRFFYHRKSRDFSFTEFQIFLFHEVFKTIKVFPWRKIIQWTNYLPNYYAWSETCRNVLKRSQNFLLVGI